MTHVMYKEYEINEYTIENGWYKITVSDIKTQTVVEEIITTTMKKAKQEIEEKGYRTLKQIFINRRRERQ